MYAEYLLLFLPHSDFSLINFKTLFTFSIFIIFNFPLSIDLTYIGILSTKNSSKHST
jgi:hypothetical protein